MGPALSSSPRSPIQNQDGQSLVQVLVSIAIMAILMVAIASMQSSQQRQVSQLSQKLASLDILRTLTATFADPSNVCTFMVKNPVPPSFDPLAVGTARPPVFNFTQIPSKGIAGAPPVVTVPSTIPASPLSHSLFVSSIQLTDLACIPSLCTPTTNQFSANITVSFDSSKTVIGLAPLKFPITVTTTGAANNQSMSSCQGGGGGGGGGGGSAGAPCSVPGTVLRGGMPMGATKNGVTSDGGGERCCLIGGTTYDPATYVTQQYTSCVPF